MLLEAPEIVEADPEEVILLSRKLELLKQKLKAVQNDGVAYYKPYAQQDAFHRATTKYRAFFAGNRSGKSTAGVIEDVSWLLRERRFYPEGDPARRSGIPQRAIRLLVLTTDWKKVDTVFTSDRGDMPGKLWTYLPQGFIVDKKKGHDGVYTELVCANGSVIAFNTVNAWYNNPNCVESEDWDAIHVDEPIPEQMFKGAARGLMDRAGTKVWFTLTPLSEPWIFDFFGPEQDPTVLLNRFSISASTSDNPHISAEGLAEFEATLTQDEIECRKHGYPLERTGLIYKQFDQSVHVYRDVPQGWTDLNTPPLDWTTYVYIDPHPRTPHAVAFYAVPPTNDCVWQFDELFIQCPIDELCKLINTRLVGRQLGWMRIDKSAFINNPTSGVTMAEAFHLQGLNVEEAVKDLQHGVLKVQEVLSKRPVQLRFAGNLRETLSEFRKYVWDMHHGRPTNKPRDCDDHMMENLYRMCIDNPQYIDPLDVSRPLRFSNDGI